MAKDKKNKRHRILKAKIDFLSLCPKGANKLQTVYKSEDDEDVSVVISSLVKGDLSEQGELTAVVYAPEMEDTDLHVASQEVIKEMAYNFAVDGTGVDIRHNQKKLSKEDAFVAESFIIDKGDTRFRDVKDYDGNPVDVTGGWGVVLKIESEDLRKQYREGKWAGISMGGMAALKEETTEVGKLTKALENLSKKIGLPYSGKIKKSENEMDSKEIKELITKTVSEGLAELKKELGIKKEDKDGKDDKPKGLGLKEPKLKADPTKEDIQKHAKELQIFELSQAVDPSNLESIYKFQQLSKAIAEGKDVKVGKEEKTSVYDSFFTNQDTTDVKKARKSDDPYGDAILAELEKEEKNK